jgi:hypothetical protein
MDEDPLSIIVAFIDGIVVSEYRCPLDVNIELRLESLTLDGGEYF